MTTSLTVSRKAHEATIVFVDDVEVVRISTSRATRLNFRAGPHVKVLRGELLDAPPVAEASCEEPFGLGLPVPYWYAEPTPPQQPDPAA